MEEWRDIAGYEGIYQVSNEGRIRSIVARHTSKPCIRKLVPSGSAKLKYLYVGLHLNGKEEKRSVHRLVAEAFIPNPHKKPEINHINGDKTDNRVENLEWVTSEENKRHAIRNGLHDEDIKSREIPVIAINISTGEKKEFRSMVEAARQLNLHPGSVARAARTKYRAGNYKFRIAKGETI